MNAFLDIDGGALDTFCRRHHIVRLALFGSRARGEARPDSDVDLLVEFEVGRAPGLIGISAMELELSELIGGLTVDLRTREDLSRHFRYRVSASALVQYAR